MYQEETLANVKKPNVVERVTREEFEYRIKEIAKCKRDITYFAEKYFKIINLDKGLMTIQLYPKQHELLKYFTEQKKCIVLAARQSSKTTTYTIYRLWKVCFFQDERIMLLANKADTGLEILSRIRLAYEYLPSWLKPGVPTWNKGQIVFANRSEIKSFATASDAARGYSAKTVIMDEAAFVPNNIASKVFESIYPVISSSKESQFIMVSTPNGADPKNLYYEIWQKANSKEKDKNIDGWKAFRFDWWDVPGRDQKWKESTIAAIGQQRFDQEFGNVFLSDAQVKKLIPDDIIEKYRIKLSELRLTDRELVAGKKQKILSENQDKLYEFTMWHEFDPRRTYLASGDCAEGVGGDDSVLYVWDVTDLSNIVQCAKFASNRVSPVEFAFITKRILSVYGSPYYICERNGVGSGYLDSLRITYKYDKCVTEGKNGDAGVYSHIITKGKGCIWAREMMTTAGFGWTIYDKDLIDEFGTFVRKDNKGVHIVYQAIAPAHDDHVMAWIWACWILQPELVEKYFVCAKTFMSALEKIYPQRLEPLKEYTKFDVKKVTDDPLYQDFLDFKEEMKQKLGHALQIEKREEVDDIYVFRQRRDMFFGDDDGPSWSTSQTSMGYQDTGLNAANRMPSFFINAGGGFM